MKRVLVILTLAALAITSCSKDKEGCNDRRASNYDENVVVDNGSCIFTTVTFYADSSHVEGIPISNIDVTVNGAIIGSFNGFFNDGNQVCGATNTAVFPTNGESLVAWSATIYQLGGTSVVSSGEYIGISNEGCVIQQILP
tara:strand:- start:83 stop:505 length:423 start_codon:yes stop_codon:yes gene_type:complete